MEIKKEIAFFVAFAAFVAWGTYDLVSGGEVAIRRSRGSSGGAMEYAPGPVPDAALALPSEDRGDDFSRDLFTPPRDTAPLPPLELEMPPIEPLTALRPPTAYGPSAAVMGSLLRVPVRTTDVPGLFEDEEIDVVVEDLGTSLDDVDDEDLTAQERLERIEARKKLYDWVLTTELKFGHIKNKDRYDLRRNNEPIAFAEVDPETGVLRYGEQGAVPYQREQIQEFGFAETAANRIELRRREFGSPLRPGELDGALRFAFECVELRNEAPQALDVAEEMFLGCTRLNPGDARAWMGLARCYELGFRFEDAYDVYRKLTEGELHTEPAPWAGLGDLFARLRLMGRAEEAYREGLRRSRTNWLANWWYGRFLLEQGRGEEALGYLSEAQRREPSQAELRFARVGIRADLGAALLHLGRPAEARDMFERARSADPSDDAGLAGLYSASLLAPGAGAEDPPGEEPDAGFDLLLALGLDAIERERWADARHFLEQARDDDPFRAWLALRSLSWLAERTGHPEEAFAFVQRAHEQNPVDPWTLYQRGRLLAAHDDVLGALESFRAALDLELDFPDALIAMGSLSHATGDHVAAERYYERALELDPERPVVHSRRGFNLFELGETDRAGEAFRAAVAGDPDLASARCGLAWWHYVNGDSEEARNRFAELEDSRRNEPEDDPYRAYAAAQNERITRHEEKEVWSDRFDRVGRVGNDWSYDVGYGPELHLREGEVWLEGTFDTEGRTRLIRELPADRLLSFEATVTVHKGRDVDVGIYVSREQQGRQGDVKVHASAELLRKGESGVPQVRLVRKGELEGEAQDLFAAEWPEGKPMRVRIDKVGDEASETSVTLWLDDVPVLEGVAVPSLGRSSQPLRFGVFVYGRSGRQAVVSVDDVNVVRRR